MSATTEIAAPTAIADFCAPAVVPPETEPTPKRWTREEYHRLAEQGFFEGQRVELIDGEIILVSPPSPQHSTSTERVCRALQEAFGPEYWARNQEPFSEEKFSEPQPDVCVVKGALEDFDYDHPIESRLIVEVSKTSLTYDTTKKCDLYAALGIPEYWVLDLVNRQLKVFRNPEPDDAAHLGHRYANCETVKEGGTVAPLDVPKAKINIGDLLPHKK